LIGWAIKEWKAKREAELYGEGFAIGVMKGLKKFGNK